MQRTKEVMVCKRSLVVLSRALIYGVLCQTGSGLEAEYFEMKKTTDFFQYKKSSAPANVYGGALLNVGIPKGRLKCAFRIRTICGGTSSVSHSYQSVSFAR